MSQELSKCLFYLHAAQFMQNNQIDKEKLEGIVRDTTSFSKNMFPAVCLSY